MDLREALFRTIAKSKISSKELSDAAGITPPMLSRFKNGKDVSSTTLQKLIDALPPEAYSYFHSLLDPKLEGSKQKSDREIIEHLFELAFQLRQNAISKKTEEQCAQNDDFTKDDNRVPIAS